MRFEPLENRNLLAGTVTVTLAAQVLTLTGDVSDNNVKITRGANVGEYKIEGVDTYINGPSLIKDPFNRIDVRLDEGGDTFTIEAADAANTITIPGTVDIDNDQGGDTNILKYAFVTGELVIENVGDGGKSTLELDGATIVGNTTVSNAFGGSDGDSKTEIKNSHLQADLVVRNGDGKDILVVYSSRIEGDVDVDNGDGDSRTVFGLNEDPIVGGNLIIINGDGNDTVILHDTDVWGTVTIDNGDGHTNVAVEQSDVGLGVPLGTGVVFDLDNGSGIDQFRMVDSTVKDDLDIDNSDVAADTYGSTTQIIASRIGDDLFFQSDNGLDNFTMSDSVVVGRTIIDVFDGSSNVTFVGTADNRMRLGENLNIAANAGVDKVIIDNTEIEGDTSIDLGDGWDVVEILAKSQLLGQTSLEGGAGIDTFWRQLTPADKRIFIAFLAWETFELDKFKEIDPYP